MPYVIEVMLFIPFGYLGMNPHHALHEVGCKHKGWGPHVIQMGKEMTKTSSVRKILFKNKTILYHPLCKKANSS